MKITVRDGEISNTAANYETEDSQLMGTDKANKFWFYTV